LPTPILNNRMKKISVISFLLLIFICGCKKNQLGGKATIKGSVLHHEKLIPKARIFIKFNTKEFPGTDTTSYDSKVVADANGNYTIECYKGNYYLYGVGYDDAIQLKVYGGLAVSIRNNETASTDVAVTE
jgi:hypothetical protein